MNLNIPDYVKSEIYIITNIITEKQYVGQTRTHVLNHNKYRPYGSQKRFNAHISEAKGNYKKQSMKLNNSIRKYGELNFNVLILLTCDIKDSDYYERHYIKQYNTVLNGYNLTEGGEQKGYTEEQMIQTSNTLAKYYIQQKLNKVHNMQIFYIRAGITSSNNIDIIHLYLSTLDGNVHKIDFGGRRCSLNDSLKSAQIIIDKININNQFEVEIGNNKLIILK